MNWITKEQAEKAGKGSQLDAAKCSWERWNQGATCTRDELVKGTVELEAQFGENGDGRCALCHYKKIHNLLCDGDCIADGNGHWCHQAFNHACKAFNILKSNLSNENIVDFQTKAKALCVVIQKFMDGLEPKAKLKHLDYGLYKRSDSFGIFEVLFVVDHKGNLQFAEKRDGCTFASLPLNECVQITKMGNLGIDLARNAEDLREYKIEGHHGGQLKAAIDETGDICITVGKRQIISANISEAQEIHQKLGQIIATAQRDKGKKK